MGTICASDLPALSVEGPHDAHSVHNGAFRTHWKRYTYNYSFIIEDSDHDSQMEEVLGARSGAEGAELPCPIPCPRRARAQHPPAPAPHCAHRPGSCTEPRGPGFVGSHVTGHTADPTLQAPLLSLEGAWDGKAQPCDHVLDLLPWRPLPWNCLWAQQVSHRWHKLRCGLKGLNGEQPKAPSTQGLPRAFETRHREPETKTRRVLDYITRRNRRAGRVWSCFRGGQPRRVVVEIGGKKTSAGARNDSKERHKEDK